MAKSLNKYHWLQVTPWKREAHFSWAKYYIQQIDAICLAGQVLSVPKTGSTICLLNKERRSLLPSIMNGFVPRKVRKRLDNLRDGKLKFAVRIYVQRVVPQSNFPASSGLFSLVYGFQKEINTASPVPKHIPPFGCDMLYQREYVPPSFRQTWGPARDPPWLTDRTPLRFLNILLFDSEDKNTKTLRDGYLSEVSLRTQWNCNVLLFM